MACLNHWIPAYAGMTAGERLGYCRTQACWNDGKGCRDDDLPCSLLIVIPAKAGIQESAGAVVNG